MIYRGRTFGATCADTAKRAWSTASVKGANCPYRGRPPSRVEAGEQGQRLLDLGDTFRHAQAPPYAGCLAVGVGRRVVFASWMASLRRAGPIFDQRHYTAAARPVGRVHATGPVAFSALFHMRIGSGRVCNTRRSATHRTGGPLAAASLSGGPLRSAQSRRLRGLIEGCSLWLALL
jgi:hypothetical protein